MTYQEDNVAACLQELQAMGAISLKAEFEAEGATSADVELLSSLASESGLDLAIKIGGCEAIRDLREALQVGAHHVVAPMIESPFAATKFERAATQESAALGVLMPRLAINIESIAGVRLLGDILKAPALKTIDRLVVGRTDLAASLGLERTHVESDEIAAIVRSVLTAGKEAGLETTLGGTVTSATARFAESLRGLLDTFETRKVIFPVSEPHAMQQMISSAVHFERAWLLLKSDKLGRLTPSEVERLNSLPARLESSSISPT